MNAVTPLRFESSSDMVSGHTTHPALKECVSRAVRRYLLDLGAHAPNDLYRVVLNEIELPMLDEVLRHCRGNQSKAAAMLGITRATLRKKLVAYGRA
jgi:Fis family transcriptional regulator